MTQYLTASVVLLCFRGKKFTRCHLITFFLSTLLFSSVGFVMMAVFNRPDPPDSARVKALLAGDPLWVGDPPLSFVVVDKVGTACCFTFNAFKYFKRDPSSMLSMTYLNVVITGSYLLLMFTSWKVWWELHSFEKDMSKPTGRCTFN